MSDLGRKGVGEQAQEKVTPDSQKSTLDKATESVTSTADKAVGAVQPGDSKSTSQKLSDTTRSGADDAQGESKGILGSAQDTLSGATESVSNALGGDKK